MSEQVKKAQEVLDRLKVNGNPTELASVFLNKFL